MIIVTGGAGFIGSNLVRALNRAGHTDILVVDDLRDAHKILNLADCRIADYLDMHEFAHPHRGGAGFGAEARGDLPPGRLHRHDGVERPADDADQLRLFPARPPVRHGAPGAADLCIVRLRVRRRPGLSRQ